MLSCQGCHNPNKEAQICEPCQYSFCVDCMQSEGHTGESKPCVVCRKNICVSFLGNGAACPINVCFNCFISDQYLAIKESIDMIDKKLSGSWY